MYEKCASKKMRSLLIRSFGGAHAKSEKNTLFRHFVFARVLRMINRRIRVNRKIFF